jgi:hypothetical protein
MFQGCCDNDARKLPCGLIDNTQPWTLFVGMRRFTGDYANRQHTHHGLRDFYTNIIDLPELAFANVMQKQACRRLRLCKAWPSSRLQ